MKRHVKSNTTSLHFTEDVFRCNLRSFVFNVSKLMITMMMRKRMQFKVSCKKGSKVSGKSSCRSTDKEFKVDKLRRFRDLIFKLNQKNLMFGEQDHQNHFHNLIGSKGPQMVGRAAADRPTRNLKLTN